MRYRHIPFTVGRVEDDSRDEATALTTVRSAALAGISRLAAEELFQWGEYDFVLPPSVLQVTTVLVYVLVVNPGARAPGRVRQERGVAGNTCLR